MKANSSSKVTTVFDALQAAIQGVFQNKSGKGGQNTAVVITNSVSVQDPFGGSAKGESRVTISKEVHPQEQQRH
ncbi:MAG: hypothetical protein WAV51_00715 [Microgenomates group bacterium]